MQIVTGELPHPVRAVLLDDVCVVNSRYGTARRFVVVHADMLMASAVSIAAACGVMTGTG